MRANEVISTICFITIVAVLNLGSAPELRAAQGEANPKVLDPGTQTAKLLKVQSGFALWLVSELIPGTERSRAQGFVHRFFRQTLEKPTGELTYEYRDTAGRFRTAVREDGALLMVTRRRLHFVPAEGKAQVTELPYLDCLVAFPDGLLVLDTEVKEPRQYYPVYFVPFDGRRIQFEKRLEVVPTGAKRFRHEEGLGQPAEPFRLGDTLAWVSQENLHTFNLANGERKSIKLARDCGWVTAYDGSTLVCGIFAFDAGTGEILGEPNYPKRPLNVNGVFAVRNRIGYYFESGGLRATDLTAIDGASVLVADVQPNLTHQDEGGMRVWDGKKWTTIAWLEEFPARPNER